MVNTEPIYYLITIWADYNILNIVVNTELNKITAMKRIDYNILNIVVNTELLVVS